MALHAFYRPVSGSSLITPVFTYSESAIDPLRVGISDIDSIFYPRVSPGQTYYELDEASTTSGILFRFKSNDQNLNLSSVSDIRFEGNVSNSISSAQTESYIEIYSDGLEYLVLSFSGAWE